MFGILMIRDGKMSDDYKMNRDDRNFKLNSIKIPWVGKGHSDWVNIEFKQQPVYSMKAYI